MVDVALAVEPSAAAVVTVAEPLSPVILVD
jgi:hypothetical protein